jgi:hypothetical protein
VLKFFYFVIYELKFFYFVIYEVKFFVANINRRSSVDVFVCFVIF